MSSPFDDLSPRAAWFMENFDIFGIAEIAASQEATLAAVTIRAERAEAAIVRVTAECDRIEAAVRDNPTSPDLAGGYLACLRHIRTALAEPEESIP